MSLSRNLLLGAIAGVTILLGLPLGRLRHPAPALRMLLNAAAVGVLGVPAVGRVLRRLGAPRHRFGRRARRQRRARSGWLFTAGLAVGLFGLVAYERWMRRRSKATGRRFGPGALAVGELAVRRRRPAGWSPAAQLALLIAVGIGLHNFAEGLAVGQSAAPGQIALATLLMIGFGLHNATEGFGIVAPLAADPQGERPSRRLLGLLGLIAGGPTFVGAALGHSVTDEALSVPFLSLAAGSILYVMVQLITVAAKAERPDLVAGGLLLGLFAGFATDAVVTLAGV